MIHNGEFTYELNLFKAFYQYILFELAFLFYFSLSFVGLASQGLMVTFCEPFD